MSQFKLESGNLELKDEELDKQDGLKANKIIMQSV